jgi:hypothetical protein
VYRTSPARLHISVSSQHACGALAAFAANGVHFGGLQGQRLSSILRHSRRRPPGATGSLLLASLLVLVGCSRPVDRPLQGAQPARVEAASEFSGPPPTLAAPERASASPLPIIIALASPSPSPALALREPILSALLPAPEALVPPGPVNIGARIAGSVELAEVTLTIDGAAVQPRITMQDGRVWQVAYTISLDSGRHEARLNARDRDGRAGGYRWAFDVQSRQASPIPAPKPAPPAPAPQPAPKLQFHRLPRQWLGTSTERPRKRDSPDGESLSSAI